MPPEVIGALFAMGTATAFGAGAVLSRMGLVGVPIFTGTVLSMVAGTTVLAIAASPRYAENLGAITGVGWGWLVFTSVINYPVGRVLLFNALSRIGAARGNTIVSANPVVAATIAVLWLGETLGAATGVGIVACVTGAMVVARASQRRGETAQPAGLSDADHATATAARKKILVTGVLSAFGAMAAYGTVSVLVKKIVTDVTDPVVGASMTFTMGTIMVALLALPRMRANLGRVPLRNALLLMVGGSGMSLGVLMFYGATIRAPVVAVAPIVSMSPLVTILVSQLLARRLERVDRMVWLGAAAVVTGVILIATAL